MHKLSSAHLSSLCVCASGNGKNNITRACFIFLLSYYIDLLILGKCHLLVNVLIEKSVAFMGFAMHFHFNYANYCLVVFCRH